MTSLKDVLAEAGRDGITLGYVQMTTSVEGGRDRYEVRCGTCGHWTADYATSAPAIRDHRKHAERKHGTT